MKSCEKDNRNSLDTTWTKLESSLLSFTPREAPRKKPRPSTGRINRHRNICQEVPLCETIRNSRRNLSSSSFYSHRQGKPANTSDQWVVPLKFLFLNWLQLKLSFYTQQNATTWVSSRLVSKKNVSTLIASTTFITGTSIWLSPVLALNLLEQLPLCCRHRITSASSGLEKIT